MRRRLALALAATSICCQRQPDRAPSISKEDAERTFDRIVRSIEVAGCSEVRAGPICELKEADTVVLWIEDPAPAAVVLRSQGRTITASASVIEGGLQLRPPLVTNDLLVRLEAGAFFREWKLSLQPYRQHPLIGEVEALRRSGQNTRAEALLDERGRELGVDQRGAALGLRARLALGRGDLEVADRLFVEAADAECNSGAMLSCASLLFARSYLLITNLRQFDRAAEVLRRAATIAQTLVTQSRVNVAYYRALLAKYQADVREALVWSAAVDRAARRLGLARLSWIQQQSSAELLLWIGQESAAFQALEDAIARPPPDVSPCEKADALTNLGWNRLLARESGAQTIDARTPLEAALELHRTVCDRPLRAANVATNLALAAIQDGEANKARELLQRAESLSPTPSLEMLLWWEDIEGRIALAEGRADRAEKIYRRLHQRAVDGASAGAQFRASLGEAQAARARDDAAAAIAAYRRAEAELDALALRVPVSIGRDSFLADREESARSLVDLLIRQNRAGEALLVARQARRRPLARIATLRSIDRFSTEQRARWNEAIAGYQVARETIAASVQAEWKLSADQLRAARSARVAQQATMQRSIEAALVLIEGKSSAPPQIEEGDLLLVYFPAAAKEWIIFAADRGSLSVARTSSVVLPASFDAALSRAKRVRVLSYGAMRAVDVHALLWRGDPLIASRPVFYALDLEPARTTTSGPALIVADASEDLRSAIAESREVERALTDKGAAVEILTGAAATTGSVRAALERARLFHYAGHGTYAGVSGFDSALDLADGPFTVADVLALRRVPSEIILAGCETSRSSIAGAEAWGLGQTFVVAGASVVVGAARPVPDGLARRFSAAYHNARGDPGERFRAATLQIAKEGGDWGVFRLISP